MTDHATRALAMHRDHVRNSVANGSLRRMIVNSIEPDGTLVLREVGTGTVHDEAYLALASPSPYAVNDYVIMGEVMGRGEGSGTTRVVLGKATNNSPVVISDAASQSTSDTANTASVTTFANAITLNLALPAGTWTVKARGDVMLAHNVNRANVRIEIDGTFSTQHTLALVTEARVVATHTRSGLAGDRTIAIRVLFKSFDAGTASARNPSIEVTAVRTG